MTLVTDWNGHYWRDRAGVWRYTLGSDPVPGARPRTSWDLEHYYPRRTVDGMPYRAIPYGRLEECPELAALAADPAALVETSALEPGSLPLRVLVPEAIWPDPATLPQEDGMWAPELERDALLGAPDICRLMGWTVMGSLWQQMSRGRFPGPVWTHYTGQRKRNYWTLPVAERARDAYRAAYPLVPRLAAQNRYRRQRLAILTALGRTPSQGGDWVQEKGPPPEPPLVVRAPRRHRQKA